MVFMASIGELDEGKRANLQGLDMVFMGGGGTGL